MSTVYQIRNLESGRVYVGATAGPIRRRWSAHTTALNGGYHQCRALQDDWHVLGSGAFDCEVIADVPQNQLADEEARWIRLRRSSGGSVYNSGRDGTYPSGSEMKVPNLRQTRETASLRPIQLAVKAGVTEATVNRLEMGHHKARISTVRKLAAALGAKPADLTRARGEGE